MAHPAQKRKCKHCKTFFHPDHRNVTRQRYCPKPECRKASKADSQRRWLQKPENRDHFTGPEHVERVRQWRLKHPGYWRRQAQETSKTTDALQDVLTPQDLENQSVQLSLTQDALQDSFLAQPAVLVGLIAHLTGLALQDDIAAAARRLQQLGCDILGYSASQQGGCNDAQTSSGFEPTQEGAQAVQLDRSASGP